MMAIDETFDVGIDTRTPVNDSYKLPFRFTGTIDKLTFNLGPEQLTDADRKVIAERLAGQGTRRASSESPMFNGFSSASTVFTATAVIELGAGLALLSCPSATAVLLIGASLEIHAALTVARVAGAALLALGIACWLARGDAYSRAARGLLAAMVLYNFGVAIILGAAGIRSQPVGIALWPAVVLHAGMTVWCIASLLG